MNHPCAGPFVGSKTDRVAFPSHEYQVACVVETVIPRPVARSIFDSIATGTVRT
eukprot:jgi/Psemu1/307314/fgenesh1_kg.321_\